MVHLWPKVITFGDGQLLCMQNDSYKFLKWVDKYFVAPASVVYLEFAGPQSVPTASGDRDLGATTRRHVQ